MAPVSREVVLAAVEEYGQAWVTQDPTRIGKLFTENAIYVERAFDQKATFRGRKAIENYWKYQICGKQTNITFRHVSSEMVRDIDKPIAVVKWLAEFTNYRYHRGSKEKEQKNVKFCQMAKLIFHKNENNENNNNNIYQIEYLEEYAQDMTGPAVKWPGIETKIPINDNNNNNTNDNKQKQYINNDDDELWRKIRFDPPKSKQPPMVSCNHCNTMFPSRTKLFTHLKETDFGPNGKCIPKMDNEKDRDILLCLSMTYTVPNPEEYIRQAFQKIFQQTKNNNSSNDNDNDNNNDNDNDGQDWKNYDNGFDTIIWAVPPELCAVAIVNVATVKLPKLVLEAMAHSSSSSPPPPPPPPPTSSTTTSTPTTSTISMDEFPNILNNAISSLLLLNDSTSSSTSSSSLSLSGKGTLKIHTAGIVNRPCAPERRDFEKYTTLIPWKLLQTNDNGNNEDNNDNDNNINNESSNNQTNSHDSNTTTNKDLDPNDTNQPLENTLQTKEKQTFKMTTAAAVQQPTIHNKNDDKNDTTTTNNNNNNNNSIWRRPFEETKAFEFVNAEIARRIKHGARLMRDYGKVDNTANEGDNDKNDNYHDNNCNNNDNDKKKTNKVQSTTTTSVSTSPTFMGDTSATATTTAAMGALPGSTAAAATDTTTTSNDTKLRIRTSTMEEPFHRFCRVSISTRSSFQGCIETLIGFLISYTRQEDGLVNDDDLIQALQEYSVTSKSAANTSIGTSTSIGSSRTNVKPFPSECIALVEPAITRYESKMKLGLCRNSMETSQVVKSSIDHAEMSILHRMETMEPILLLGRMDISKETY